MAKHIKKNTSNEKMANRLREEIIKHYQKIDIFAKLCDIAPSNLRSNYLSGKSIPGGKHLLRFYELGLDINYILTGQTLIEKKKNQIFKLQAENEDLKWQRKLLFYMLTEWGKPFGYTEEIIIEKINKSAGKIVLEYPLDIDENFMLKAAEKKVKYGKEKEE